MTQSLHIGSKMKKKKNFGCLKLFMRVQCALQRDANESIRSQRTKEGGGEEEEEEKTGIAQPTIWHQNV